jgi:hypothetical protein
MFGILPTYPASPAPLFVNVGSSYTSVGAPTENGRTDGIDLSQELRQLNGGGLARTSHPDGFRAFMFTAAYSDHIEGCWVNVNAASGSISPTGTFTGVTLFKLVPSQ